jgi:hypothetical protein
MTLRLRLVLAVLVASGAVAPPATGRILRVTPEVIDRALTLARWPTSDADRKRFHDRYIIPVNGPAVQFYSVEKLEITTEFRRLELIAEEHARLNDMFGRGGLQEVELALAPWRNRLSITVHLRFTPNGFITGIPNVDVLLDGAPPFEPRAVDSRGIYTALGNGPGTMLVGGVIETVFDARQIGQSTRTAVVRALDANEELARVPIDFRSFD